MRRALLGLGVLVLLYGIAVAAPVVPQLFRPDHPVLDCSDDAAPCARRPLPPDRRLCAPWNARKCARKREHVARAALVADELNLVPGPMAGERLRVEPVEATLRQPWDLEFLPDGSMLVSERRGRVQHLVEGGTRTVLRLAPLVEYETGLLGLAVDPDFAATRAVYLYYTVGPDEDAPPPAEHGGQRRVRNRISRFVLDGGALHGETVLLDDIPGSTWHSGGRLEFGPDGKLYATTGEAADPVGAQDPSFLGGKVLRLERDGSVPADNPIAGSPVYSRGHRNPQGLAWHPVSGALYTSEHGPRRRDEINRIRPGQSHGWGAWACDERLDAAARTEPIAPPLFCARDWTMAPSGMTFVDDPESPWHGQLFVAALRGKHVRRFHVEDRDAATDAAVTAHDVFFVSDRAGGEGLALDRRIRDVEFRDGALYVLGDGYGLVRVAPVP